MKQGGFNLRKWRSNNSQQPNLVSHKKTNHTLRQRPTREKTWNTESDKFLFDFADLFDLARSLPVTKRSLLKLTTKIFDLLGLLSPFVIKLKILFQELCVQKIDWDEEHHGSVLSKWQSTLLELESLSKVKLSLCYFTEKELEPSTIQLHGFSDASRQAYAAAVYLRSEWDGVRVQVELVASKTKIAHLKKQSTPRLELLAATNSLPG